MGRILGVILSTALAILALYGGPSEAQECSHGKITGRCRDIGLIRSVKQNGYNLSSDGLVLWESAILAVTGKSVEAWKEEC